MKINGDSVKGGVLEMVVVEARVSWVEEPVGREKMRQSETLSLGSRRETGTRMKTALTIDLFHY